MRVLGIDPGSRKMGIAVVEGEARRLRPVAYASIRFGQATMVQRLQTLHAKVGEWLATYKPDAVAVEEIFVRNNVKSALVLGQARGAVLLAIGAAGLEPSGYAPATIKRAVAGHGHAGKPEMRAMVKLQLGLAKSPPEDAADALAVAMTHILEYDIRKAALPYDR